MRRVDAMTQRNQRREGGFTLIEAIMVITITGIVAGMVAVFIRSPIEAYVDSARRAELTDAADTAARFMTREVQGALPNSVRADATHLEFIPIMDAGRYRAEVGTNAGDDPLDFSGAGDTRFDVLGPAVTVGAGDSLVVYNLGIPGSDAYEMPTTNRRAAIGGGAAVTFTATASSLPFPSPGSRFHIVGTPVSYVCDGTRLLRYAGYGFPNPSTLTPTTNFGAAVPSVLATNVTACGFNYGTGALQRFGLVSILLSIGSAGETVTLQQQVSVDNVP